MKTFEVVLSDGRVYTEENVSNVRFNSSNKVWETFSDLQNMKILEIGPRLSRWFIREQLKLNNCDYYSICNNDKDHTTALPDGKIKEPGSYKLNTSKLMDYFDEDYFDVIMGIQSFEHWGEIVGNGAYVDGIYQCGKVIKSKGWFIQDFPICHHGQDYFVYEKWNELRELFDRNVWGDVEILEYGKEGVSNTDHIKCSHVRKTDESQLKCINCSWVGMLKVQKL